MSDNDQHRGADAQGDVRGRGTRIGAKIQAYAQHRGRPRPLDDAWITICCSSGPLATEEETYQWLRIGCRPRGHLIYPVLGGPGSGVASTRVVYGKAPGEGRGVDE